MMGIRVPRLYFVSNVDPGMSDGKAGRLRSKIMRDFVGLDKVDNETRDALLSFSYFLTVGDMDKAYRAVKFINNPGIFYIFSVNSIFCIFSVNNIFYILLKSGLGKYGSYVCKNEKNRCSGSVSGKNHLKLFLLLLLLHHLKLL